MIPEHPVEMQRPISPQAKPYLHLPSTAHLTSPNNLPMHYSEPYDRTNRPEYLPQPKTIGKADPQFDDVEKPNAIAGRRRKAPTRLIVDPKKKTYKQS